MSAIGGYAAICHLSCKGSCRIPFEVKYEIYWPLMVGVTDEMAWKCTQVPPECWLQRWFGTWHSRSFELLSASAGKSRVSSFASFLAVLELDGYGHPFRGTVVTLFSRKFLSSSQQEIRHFHDNQKKSKWPCIKRKIIQFRMWIELQVTKHKHSPKELAICKLIGFSIDRQKTIIQERRNPDTLLLLYING